MKGVTMLLVENSTGYERARDCAEITARSGSGGFSWRSREQNQGGYGFNGFREFHGSFLSSAAFLAQRAGTKSLTTAHHRVRCPGERPMHPEVVEQDSSGLVASGGVSVTERSVKSV